MWLGSVCFEEKRPVQMFFRGTLFTFILEYISELVFSYLSIEVESVLLLLPQSSLHNYLYFYPS